MTQNAVDFSALVRVSLAVERTFAAWIYPTDQTDIRAIIAPFADSGGVVMYIGNNALLLYSNRFNSLPGAWASGTTTINNNAWYHVVVTYDHRLTTNDPLMYINGIPQTVNEIFTPAGTLNVELGTHVVIGNVKTVTQDYTWGFKGKIFDARIYDRIITAAEAATLYNSGTPDPSLVTDGLIFQAFAVMTAQASDYIDRTLDETDRILENVFRAAGRINGSPIARVAP